MNVILLQTCCTGAKRNRVYLLDLSTKQEICLAERFMLLSVSTVKNGLYDLVFLQVQLPSDLFNFHQLTCFLLYYVQRITLYVSDQLDSVLQFRYNKISVFKIANRFFFSVCSINIERLNYSHLVPCLIQDLQYNYLKENKFQMSAFNCFRVRKVSLSRYTFATWDMFYLISIVRNSTKDVCTCVSVCTFICNHILQLGRNNPIEGYPLD